MSGFKSYFSGSFSLRPSAIRDGRFRFSLDSDLHLGTRLQAHFLATLVDQLVFDANFFVQMIRTFDGNLSFLRFLVMERWNDLLYCSRQSCLWFFRHEVQALKVVRDAASIRTESAGAQAFRLRSVAFYAEFEPVVAESRPHQHPGVELLYLISGKLDLTIGSETFTLASGDAVYFYSERAT